MSTDIPQMFSENALRMMSVNVSPDVYADAPPTQWRMSADVRGCFWRMHRGCGSGCPCGCAVDAMDDVHGCSADVFSRCVADAVADVHGCSTDVHARCTADAVEDVRGCARMFPRMFRGYFWQMHCGCGCRCPWMFPWMRHRCPCRRYHRCSGGCLRMSPDVPRMFSADVSWMWLRMSMDVSADVPQMPLHDAPRM